MYQPSVWHDYFMLVGAGGATLTGLVFVAMTLHLEDVMGDTGLPASRPNHFDRAYGRLHPMCPGAHGRSERTGRRG